MNELLSNKVLTYLFLGKKCLILLRMPIERATLAAIVLIYSVKLNLWSTIIPNYFALETLGLNQQEFRLMEM